MRKTIKNANQYSWSPDCNLNCIYTDLEAETLLHVNITFTPWKNNRGSVCYQKFIISTCFAYHCLQRHIAKVT